MVGGDGGSNAFNVNGADDPAKEVTPDYVTNRLVTLSHLFLLLLRSIKFFISKYLCPLTVLLTLMEVGSSQVDRICAIRALNPKNIVAVLNTFRHGGKHNGKNF